SRRSDLRLDNTLRAIARDMPPTDASRSSRKLLTRGVVRLASLRLPMRWVMWVACWRYCASVEASRPCHSTDLSQFWAPCATVIDLDTGVCVPARIFEPTCLAVAS